MAPSPRSRTWRRLRRAVLARRRLVGALLTGAAVLAGLHAVEAPAEPTVPVVVAGTDLPGGTAVRSAQLDVAQVAGDRVPDGAATARQEVVGRVLAAPVRRGEPITDVRLVAPTLLAGYPGAVAAPVRIADVDAVALLRVGDRVDVVAARDGSAEVVASDAPIVALPRQGRRSDDPSMAGGLVVLAVSGQTALNLAEASVSRVLSVVVDG